MGRLVGTLINIMHSHIYQPHVDMWVMPLWPSFLIFLIQYMLSKYWKVSFNMLAHHVREVKWYLFAEAHQGLRVRQPPFVVGSRKPSNLFREWRPTTKFHTIPKIESLFFFVLFIYVFIWRKNIFYSIYFWDDCTRSQDKALECPQSMIY